MTIEPAGESTRGAQGSLEDALRDAIGRLDTSALRGEFLRQGAFLHVPQFLPAAVTAGLAAAARAVEPMVNRNYLPGHKQGGSVSRHTLDRHAAAIGRLYRSAALVDWLQRIAGEPLQLSPTADPHAYAFYYYTQRGDHIGWHYDTSYYAGRRYTVLVGVVDESSCRLDYELHTRDRGTPVVAASVRIAPGGLVVFDGDRLRHRISPLAEGERRISLTLEYVTDTRMGAAARLLSNLKDAFAYFGLRQVFGRRRGPERETG